MERLRDEENLSTQPDTAETTPRLPSPDEDPWRPGDLEESAGEGAKAPHRLGRHQVAVSENTDRFRRSERLLRSRDFQRVSRLGGRTISRYFVARNTGGSGRPASDHPIRLGITVSRAIGNAVARNRVKRLIREWYRRTGREELRHLGDGDLVIIARRPVRKLPGNRVLRELSALANRIENFG